MTRSVMFPFRRSSTNLDQTPALERPEVVVDLLTGQTHGWSAKEDAEPGSVDSCEETGPDRFEGYLGHVRVVDDRYVLHGDRISRTVFIVKTVFVVLLDDQRHLPAGVVAAAVDSTGLEAKMLSPSFSETCLVAR